MIAAPGSGVNVRRTRAPGCVTELANQVPSPERKRVGPQRPRVDPALELGARFRRIDRISSVAL